jgi:hypothetical protein
VVAATPGVSTAVVRGALNEATAIWKSAAIAIDWRLSNGAPTGGELPTVQVVFDEAGGSPSGPDLPLGWINFDADGVPETVVHLSQRNVLQLLDSAEAYRNRPTAYKELLAARALGRALAHELGHQLMASKVHTPSGLMKAHRLIDDLLSPSRVGFTLTTDERQRAAGGPTLMPHDTSKPCASSSPSEAV